MDHHNTNETTNTAADGLSAEQETWLVLNDHAANPGMVSYQPESEANFPCSNPWTPEQLDQYKEVLQGSVSSDG